MKEDETYINAIDGYLRTKEKLSVESCYFLAKKLEEMYWDLINEEEVEEEIDVGGEEDTGPEEDLDEGEPEEEETEEEPELPPAPKPIKPVESKPLGHKESIKKLMVKKPQVAIKNSEKGGI
jgi:hypothetical protein